MNIVLVIVDTLRQDHLGAYGNAWVKTPHLDAFAGEAVRFTRAYSESLPTVPVRRTLHTGRRVFPFHDHREYKGAGGGILGWAPIPEDQDTVAETLSSRGYRSALITDTYHQFKPSMNFHRGFDEWVWVRGQEGDTYRSGPAVSDDRMGRHRYGPTETRQGMAKYLDEPISGTTVNGYDESDYLRSPAYSVKPPGGSPTIGTPTGSFLVVDSFDPHEPWDPPAWYRELYDPDDEARRCCWDATRYVAGQDYSTRVEAFAGELCRRGDDGGPLVRSPYGDSEADLPARGHGSGRDKRSRS